MKNVVSIIDGELRLCSGLTEYAFGKTNYNSVVTQKGLLAQCDSKKDEPLHFSFSPWTFQDIKSFDVEGHDERIVFFCAPNPLSKKARTLYELFADAGTADAGVKEKDKMYSSSLAVCSALTQAATEGLDIPINGAGGILIEDNSILFLPHDIFLNSTAALPALDQADTNNCWINPSLRDLPALCFLRASIAYKMLTGRFAYPASDTLTRNADLLDKNFLPLELSINGINPELANAVNKGLKLNSNSINIPGKKPKGKKSEELIPEASFPLQLLSEAKNSTAAVMSDKEFEDKVKNYKKLQGSKINTKRTFRRNTAAFTAGLIAFVFLLLYIRSSYKNYMDDYTSKGLTSTQTVQAFFKGMNNLDISLLEEIAKGKSTNRYVDSISNVYVIGKQRMATGGDQGFLKPAKYFLTVTDYSRLKLGGLYGFTNLKIDGKDYDEYIEPFKNKDKAAPIETEKGISLKNGDKSVHSVEYYSLHTEGDNYDVLVTYNKDTFTLTYKKDRWIITGIEPSQTDLNLDSNKFKDDYFKAVTQNNGDVIKSIKELSFTYEFLPSVLEMTTEKKILEEYLANPYKDILGF
ncbi:MAG: hypothetical protein IK102_11915 [Treponema sp.]|nr:hypothetical protein [Treponema sp.]